MATFSVPCEATAHCQPYSSLYYTIILYHTILYHTIPYHTILYYTTLHYTILFYPILCYPMLCYTILYYTHTLVYSLLSRQRMSDIEASWEGQPTTVFSSLSVTILNYDLSRTQLSLFVIGTVFSWVWIKLCSEYFEEKGQLTYYLPIQSLPISVFLFLTSTLQLSSWLRSDHKTNYYCIGRGQSEHLLQSTTQIQRSNLHDEKPCSIHWSDLFQLMWLYCVWE